METFQVQDGDQNIETVSTVAGPIHQKYSADIWGMNVSLGVCEWFECRTRFECSLPNQGGIMSHHYM